VPVFVNYKKECTRLAAAGDKVYQLLAHGRCLFLSFAMCLVPNVSLDWPLLMDLIDLIFGVLTPLSTIFQLYHGDQF
jgi:hypothetical protein